MTSTRAARIGGDGVERVEHLEHHVDCESALRRSGRFSTSRAIDVAALELDDGSRRSARFEANGEMRGQRSPASRRQCVRCPPPRRRRSRPRRGAGCPGPTCPAPVRSAVEARLASRVVAAHSQDGGFSPGVAARLELADGTRVFVKAVVHPAERGLARHLPAGGADRGRVPGGRSRARAALVVGRRRVGGARVRRRRRPHARAAVARRRAGARARGRVDAGRHARPRRRSRSTRRASRSPGCSAAGAASPATATAHGIPAAVRATGSTISSRSSRAGPHGSADGDTLVHLDLRADNRACSLRERVLVVDWPSRPRSASARWLDLAAMLPQASRSVRAAVVEVARHLTELHQRALHLAGRGRRPTIRLVRRVRAPAASPGCLRARVPCGAARRRACRRRERGRSRPASGEQAVARLDRAGRGWDEVVRRARGDRSGRSVHLTDRSSCERSLP